MRYGREERGRLGRGIRLRSHHWEDKWGCLVVQHQPAASWRKESRQNKTNTTIPRSIILGDKKNSYSTLKLADNNGIGQGARKPLKPN